jgi:Domain of unknown function (DUF1839)
VAPSVMGAAMRGSIQVLPGLDAAAYRPSPLHAEQCAWVEKNCYIDVWIEVVHSLGLEPAAMLAMTLAVDFEGDQWTFYKPPHDELRDLYGIDVQELTVWRSLLEHAQEQLAAGKLISTEADAFWMPDTAGTDYRRQHTKSTIVLADLDIDSQRLGYFHNTGYHVLEGEDFRQLFRVGAPVDPTFMPLFAEVVRLDRVVRRPEPELRQLARVTLARHLGRIPTSNPVRRFADRFISELPRLQQRELGHYHLWAFATIRQLGSAFELAAAHMRWLFPTGQVPAESAAMAFQSIAELSKTLILKAARAVNSGRALDASALFDEMAIAWERGMQGTRLALKV